MSRRGFVLSSVALATLALAKPQAIVFASDADFQSGPFMIVSRLVSADALDLRTAQALYGALSKKTNFDANLRALANLASVAGTTVETLAAQLDATQQHALRDTLNQVVSAWYLGIVDNKTYAYQSELMYRPTADVLSPPSYARGPAELGHVHSSGTRLVKAAVIAYLASDLRIT
ncbi:sugar dehydrogenase complex small subunit [Candidatus Burkholderia verschuerenii]|nr:sugar dehydrogenase complex small subunit [Candidatus Burkholderia verschuerenii]